MIKAEDMFEDLRQDEIGNAINALRSRQKWDKEKYLLRDRLFQKLQEQNYIKQSGTSAQFCMKGGIGFSYLYQVPLNKRGIFSEFSGKLIRLVYYASTIKNLEICLHEVAQNQKGRSFLEFGDCDPREYFHKVYGELKSKSIQS